MPGTGGGKGRAPRSVARLLAAQPAGLRKDPRFIELLARLAGSEALRRYRLPPVAYRLLDVPRLKPEFAANFRSTYRFPDGPFLDAFLELKWERRAGRELARRERGRRIDAAMAAFPPEAMAGLLYLRDAERALNPDAPEWKKGPYPRSLKAAEAMAGIGLERALALVAAQAEALRRRYRSISLPATDAILACSILGCAPDRRTGKLPSKAALRANFRKACKARHPDAGGDPSRFIITKRAFDYLAMD
jgi:hypothetical protein